MVTRSEAALYAPVKAFLAALGYEVKGEVRDCDLVAARGQELVIVELKRAVNLSLILQGIDRQRMTDAVYLAVEAPRLRREARRWREIQRLCRLLGLGLMTVSFAVKDHPRVEVICDPGPYTPRKADSKRRLLLAEFQKRTGDHNTGGSRKRPVVTAYREQALLIAKTLRDLGPTKTDELRAATGIPRAADFLRRNVYNWFERVERGVYRLTPQGEEALSAYADVVSGWA